MKNKKWKLKLIEMPRYRCKKCGRKWQSRILTRPLTCPTCRQPGWDRPRRKKHAVPGNNEFSRLSAGTNNKKEGKVYA